MILVNNPGSGSSSYAALRHADWHGWTLADLIFPFFLFTVGVSLVFSCAKRSSSGQSRLALLRHVLWRSLALVASGLVLNGLFYLPWATVRLPGVLQRIGVVYFFTAVLMLTATRRVRLSIAVVLLVGYWAVMALVPIPGHAAGDLSPAGNLASYLDRRLLLGHLWQPTWDPEGVLSTAPAIATALLGTFTGEWLQSKRNRATAAVGLLMAGVAALLVGAAWGRVFPINKDLWTSSFAVFTSGMAAVALAVCYWAADVKGWRWWGRAFVFFGVNPLAIYAGSEIVGMAALPGIRAASFGRLMGLGMSPPMASLAWAAAYVAVWWIVAWIMYRNTILIKL